MCSFVAVKGFVFDIARSVRKVIAATAFWAALGKVRRLEVALKTLWAAGLVVFGPGVAAGVDAATLAVVRVLANGDGGAATVVEWVHWVGCALVAVGAAGGAVPALPAALAVGGGAAGGVGALRHALAVVHRRVVALEPRRAALLLLRPRLPTRAHSAALAVLHH
eukprot:CAMPEP_0171936560 /NCGR_PEP_ID=MMETSP0993-20121228/33911_1 /TAXON_ID=483369 /ORGANISM="non described non described, Strain CCMP2098" /LENGTH=164 /DNA_ID=CAMNT_0012577757 /DNA_START=167 /DNA_END=662 /DNA_ORIENTATION=+